MALLSAPTALPPPHTRLIHHAAHRDSLGLLGMQAQGLCTCWLLLPPLTASRPFLNPLLQVSAPSLGTFPGHPTKISDALLLPACLCPRFNVFHEVTTIQTQYIYSICLSRPTEMSDSGRRDFLLWQLNAVSSVPQTGLAKD